MFNSVSGEAAEQKILDRLRANNCIIVSSVMLPLRDKSGWMYSLHIRRPRWFSRIAGHGPELHLNITAEVQRCGNYKVTKYLQPGTVVQTRQQVILYKMGCMRVDGSGSYKSWTRNDLDSMLSSI